MNQTQLKALAESFRNVSGDKTAIAKLSTDTKSANAGDTSAAALCDRFAASTDAAAVNVIANEIKNG